MFSTKAFFVIICNTLHRSFGKCIAQSFPYEFYHNYKTKPRLRFIGPFPIHYDERFSK